MSLNDGRVVTNFICQALNNQPITIYGWHKGAIREIFYSNCYSEIPVKNNIIVDVGANIGDSALYFALKGADKIIAGMSQDWFDTIIG